jgi:hypothetical protein
MQFYFSPLSLHNTFNLRNLLLFSSFSCLLRLYVLNFKYIHDFEKPDCLRINIKEKETFQI